MALGLIGKKLGMTQVYDKDGIIIPVTLIEAGPCPIILKKSEESNGYSALQVGFDPIPDNRIKKIVNKPDAGHFKKAGISPLRIVREFRIGDVKQYEIGQILDVSLFTEGESVDVIGISKGRGFAGTVKKWHTHRGPETHGSKYHRRVGSMGASSDPSRVYKGKKMPGHMGNKRCTILNLTIVGADKTKNLLVVKGSIPGHTNAYVLIRKKADKAGKSAKR